MQLHMTYNPNMFIVEILRYYWHSAITKIRQSVSQKPDNNQSVLKTENVNGVGLAMVSAIFTVAIYCSLLQ